MSDEELRDLKRSVAILTDLYGEISERVVKVGQKLDDVIARNQEWNVEEGEEDDG